MKIRQRFWSLLLHSEIKKIVPSHRCLRAPAYILAALLLPFLFSAVSTILAGSATWDLNATSGDWNTAANWTPMTVPNGPADIATFGLSNTTNVSISASTEVNEIVFTAAATNSYFIDIHGDGLTLSGTGITNNSGIAQALEVDSGLRFLNSSTAGSASIDNFYAIGFPTRPPRVARSSSTRVDWVFTTLPLRVAPTSSMTISLWPVPRRRWPSNHLMDENNTDNNSTPHCLRDTKARSLVRVWLCAGSPQAT